MNEYYKNILKCCPDRIYARVIFAKDSVLECINNDKNKCFLIDYISGVDGKIVEFCSYKIVDLDDMEGGIMLDKIYIFQNYRNKSNCYTFIFLFKQSKI